MTDEQQRIRGYLQAQGARLSPEAVVGKIREAMAQLRAAAATVPPARFAERPAPEEWSANEVMAHVVDAGRYFGGAVVSMLDGRPLPPRPSPASGGTSADTTVRPLAGWWDILERDRAALFERVAGADPSARLDATVEHAMFGPLNWRETLLFMRLHDLDHAGQLGTIAAALA